MYEHQGFHSHGRGMGHGGCGCGRHEHSHGEHRHFHRGHGWAFLTHEERVERLLEAKEALESQLAEIQKTLDLLQAKPEQNEQPQN